MKISINEEIFKLFPDLKLGVVVLKDFKLASNVSDIDLLRSEEENQRKLLNLENLSEQEFISSWRKAYALFGSKPSKYKSSIEALERRVLKGDELPHINYLVNIYNYLSLKYHVPFGGEDMDMIKGDVQLKKANGSESGKYIGSDEIDTAGKGEVIYADNLGFIVRRFNWREANRTKITESSENIILVCEAINSNFYENIEEATAELASLLKSKGEVKSFYLDYENKEKTIEFEAGTKLTQHDIQTLKEQKQEVIKKKTIVVDEPKAVIETESLRTIKKDIKDWIELSLGLENQNIEILETSDFKFGDYSTNIAMVLAGINKSNPRETASDLLIKLNSNKPDYIEKIDIAGPGFINFYLSNDYYEKKLHEILEKKDDFGKFDLGKGKQIMVEFGQPNTHKAFHLGHLKSAISGRTIVRIFENFSYKVIKANYFGDVGMQVAKCMWGLKQIEIPEGIENKNPDQKIALLQKAYTYGANKFKDDPEAEKEIRYINKSVYSKADLEVNELYDKTRSWSIEHQDEVFGILDIHYDRQYPESEVAAIGKQLVLDNIPKVFKKDQEAIIFEGEKYGLHNRVFITKDNVVTYEGKDMALGKLKNEEYDFIHSFIFTAIDHIEYFKVVIKALEQVVPELNGRYHHIPFGFMLIRGKKESSRSGISMTGKELIMQMIDLSMNNLESRKDFDDEERQKIAKIIGLNSLAYMILKHPFHVSISFNPDEALSIEGNSAPYLMYTYARANSIIAKSKINIEDLVNAKFIRETNNEEELVKLICKYEEVLVNSLDKMSPHIIANYVYELSTVYNKFYRANPVLGGVDENLKRSRLLLTYATAQIIKNGLYLLHIEVIEKM